MGYRWSCDDSLSFDDQGDAEDWLRDNWADLLARGVDDVTLFRDVGDLRDFGGGGDGADGGGDGGGGDVGAGDRGAGDRGVGGSGVGGGGGGGGDGGGDVGVGGDGGDGGGGEAGDREVVYGPMSLHPPG